MLVASREQSHEIQELIREGDGFHQCGDVSIVLGPTLDECKGYQQYKKDRSVFRSLCEQPAYVSLLAALPVDEPGHKEEDLYELVQLEVPEVDQQEFQTMLAYLIGLDIGISRTLGRDGGYYWIQRVDCRWMHEMVELAYSRLLN